MPFAFEFLCLLSQLSVALLDFLTSQSFVPFQASASEALSPLYSHTLLCSSLLHLIPLS